MRNCRYELRYLPLFYEELDHDVSYIAYELGNQDVANRLLDDVETAILKRLEDGPELFEEVPAVKERHSKYFRIYVRNYVIYYTVIDEDDSRIMEVRRFLHAREDRYRKLS